MWLMGAATAATWPGDEDFSLPPLSAELYRPVVDGVGLSVDGADAGEGAVADLVWTHQPLVFRRDAGDTVALVGDLVGASIAAAGRAGPVRLEGYVPVYVVVASDLGAGSAVGDAWLGASLPRTLGSVAVAPVGRVGLPLGGDAWALGAGGWAGELGLNASWRGPVAVGLNTGLTLVADEVAANVVVGDSLWVRGGTSYLRDHWRVGLEGVLRTPLSAFFVADGNTPVEAMLSGGWRALRIGVGAGVLPGVGSPAWRLVVGAGTG